MRDAPASAPSGRAPAADPVPTWPMTPARLAEVELESLAWSEIGDLIRTLTPDERLVPGYFSEPPWSVKDLVGHLSAWHVEARKQLLDFGAHAYLPHDVDVDERNDLILDGLRGLSWDIVWDRASGSRVWMLDAWFRLREPDDGAAEWVRKAGAEHYAEHLPRLRSWVSGLISLRSRRHTDERDP